MQIPPIESTASLGELPLADVENMESEGNLSQGAGSLRDRLLGLVKQILARNSITQPIAADDSLTEVGLASIEMISLMLAIEAEFDITIPASEITPDNFRSISTIELLVLKLGSQISG
jgi:acyl carrier protein